MDRQAPTGLPPSGPNGAWLRYKKQFITPDNVQNGVAFWNQYQDALNRAYQVYGVPPEIIVGIIGVETRWGRVMGKTRILDALATLSFNYPRRAEYFSSELETFLLMARSEQDDPLDLKGSFAGAMGYGQFMPSSYRQYAVDFNGDGHINLWDPVDAIGSVANYFKQHGWVSGDLVAVQALGQAPGLNNGFKTKYSVSQLAAADLPRLSRWVTISRRACCVWISAQATSTGTVCRTSTPLPAITTAPITRWPSGSWVWRFLRPACSNPVFCAPLRPERSL
jgi:membrane-bound lytic murein transglycosylase B